ncbi:Dolichol phosphate-mannose biosynthesis regulatory [Carpediemonas membranifera]|uniref:Dolichol phosphate-mannose biosynthesis regulatory protein n=1 Tax=Carpediemonas membranifera TaxID=201153 RepID=A0A8J6B9R1_9EUKA|nr:Dolichol phosphate-mannose biosynthesis regulatory [Carpediemonas membranifera]|eukprot:KAG9396164.1 Dolichol phosphate-mannose biosynthesis regulatory [Carpediemonas membranifera]
MLADRLFGLALIAWGVGFMTFYLFWVLITPFIPANTPFIALFPDAKYANYLVATVGGCGFIFIALYVLRTKMKEAKKKNAAKKAE